MCVCIAYLNSNETCSAIISCGLLALFLSYGLPRAYTFIVILLYGLTLYVAPNIVNKNAFRMMEDCHYALVCIVYYSQTIIPEEIALLSDLQYRTVSKIHVIEY